MVRLQNFHLLSIGHLDFSAAEMGLLHIESGFQKEVLNNIRTQLGLGELMYLSTCNRIEIYFTYPTHIEQDFITQMVKLLNPGLNSSQIRKFLYDARLFHARNAVDHALRVACSLESLVVGEREIIAQIRKAYHECELFGITGEFLRILNKHTIETAKQVFTQTSIAKSPVSVVSLAYRLLREKKVKENARCIFVGAGQTNRTMAQYLKKHRFSSFAVFNRSVKSAQEFAEVLGGEGFSLQNLDKYNKGFDILITCTGSKNPVITKEIYEKLLRGEGDRKIVIDLAVPSDLQSGILTGLETDYISIGHLKGQAKKNLAMRRSEIKSAEYIIEIRGNAFEIALKERELELAFREIPRKIKEINQLALSQVFAKELGQIDAKTKITVERIVGYLEKKYNAVAITTAKKALL